jgi:hypothetical protein
MNIDCVFSRKNISPPASNGEIGVVMTGILRSIPYVLISEYRCSSTLIVKLPLLPVYHALSMQVCGTGKRKGRQTVAVREVGAFDCSIPSSFRGSRAPWPTYVVLAQDRSRRQSESIPVLRPQLGRLDPPIPDVAHCIRPWFRDRRPRPQSRSDPDCSRRLQRIGLHVKSNAGSTESLPVSTREISHK